MTEIGVQTFTVRRAQRKSILRAYLPLIEMGVRCFEVARIDFNEKNARELLSLCEEHDVRVCSIQVKPKYVFGEMKRIIDFCRTVRCDTVVISMLPWRCILGDEKKFYDFIASLDPICREYADNGITLAYHHHNWEYIRLSSGKTRMEELISGTRLLKFVHDTYWTARSGISPALQIGAFGDRLVGIHLRDLSFRKSGIKVLPRDAALGDGVIDFSAVLDAADKVGCRYFVIEQNTKDPYGEIQKSIKTIKTIDKNREVNNVNAN